MFGSREEKVKKGFLKHLELVRKCLEEMRETVIAYFKEEEEKFLAHSFNVHKLESEADKVRREVELKLFEGAFIPAHREDFLNLIESFDKIADEAEASMDLIVLSRPQIPKKHREEFIQLVEDILKIFEALREATFMMYENRKKCMKYIEEVENLESEIDEREWKLLKRIFSSDLDGYQKLLIRELTQKLSDITDRAENTSDLILGMLAKRII
ncbi:MAG: TIGR00153 family protein [Candidatus Methanofastidiosia archaeon]